MAEHQLTCAWCGAQFKRRPGKGRQKSYCSRKCKPVSRSPKPRRSTYVRREDRPEACEGCGDVAPLYKSFCPGCMDKQKRIRIQACQRKHGGAGHLPPFLLDARCVSSTCRECGEAFKYVSSYLTQVKPRIYCGRKCQKKADDRARTQARRAIQRQVSADKIDSTLVFERDAWRCGICGRKTDKAKRGTWHPNAPELDHIVALANGGTHTWDNVQCSHRSCNGAKSATDYGQIPMFPMCYGG